jgi:hypothetical protein
VFQLSSLIITIDQDLR